jgi:Protein of unknown function (DUF3696)/AAA ATPase domain
MRSPLKLAKVRGANYKAFEGSFELELAPVTLVFGRNGSGKTALIRLPLAIAESLGGPEAPGLPLQVRDMVLGHSLASFVHGGTADRYELGVELQGDGRVLTLDVTIRHDPKTQIRLPGQWIDRWSLHDDSGDLSTFAWSNADKRYRVDGSTALEPPTRFRGLLPVLADDTPHPAARELGLAPRVVHLGAARGVPGEDFAPEQPNVALDVGSDGASTRRVLGALRFHPRPEILQAVIDNVRECFDVDLRVEEVAQGAIAGTVLSAKPCGRSTWRPIAELGTGLAHALPLLVQYAVAAHPDQGAPSPLILCEEPEAHAHPQIQARLADVVWKSVRTGRDATLLETHSETFVLRIRRRIAEGLLKPEDVALYWVDDERPTTEVRRLHIDERGHIEDWPDGWFDTALHEVRAIHRALGAP